jgi:hypothetical protein
MDVNKRTILCNHVHPIILVSLFPQKAKKKEKSNLWLCFVWVRGFDKADARLCSLEGVREYASDDIDWHDGIHLPIALSDSNLDQS